MATLVDWADEVIGLCFVWFGIKSWRGWYVFQATPHEKSIRTTNNSKLQHG